MSSDVPLQMAASAMVIPNGVASGSALAITSDFAPLGLLSAGKAESSPAIPAVKF